MYPIANLPKVSTWVVIWKQHFEYDNEKSLRFSEEDPKSFKTVSFKFHQLFNLPNEDKLVNYYSCR